MDSTVESVNLAMRHRIDAVLAQAAEGWAVSPIAQPELPPPMPMPAVVPAPARPGNRLTTLLLVVLLLLLLLGIVCVVTLPRDDVGEQS